jgi:8-hydroxy-5-deazaflavin:NADPH oxidoreductase
MQIGFLGGTGIEGKGLAIRFAASDVSVVIGSRSRERGVETADRYNTILGRKSIQGMSNQEMLACCDLIFLTVPPQQAVAAIQSVHDHFRKGQILIDVTVPMLFRQGRAEYVEQEGGISNSEALAKHLPEGVQLAAAFKTIPAHVLEDNAESLNCNIFVCSDSEEARGAVIELAGILPAVRPLDAGNLITARTLERMTVLAVNLNRKYKKKGARYRIEGL